MTKKMRDNVRRMSNRIHVRQVQFEAKARTKQDAETYVHTCAYCWAMIFKIFNFLHCISRSHSRYLLQLSIRTRENFQEIVIAWIENRKTNIRFNNKMFTFYCWNITIGRFMLLCYHRNTWMAWKILTTFCIVILFLNIHFYDLVVNFKRKMLIHIIFII